MIDNGDGTWATVDANGTQADHETFDLAVSTLVPKISSFDMDGRPVKYVADEDYTSKSTDGNTYTLRIAKSENFPSKEAKAEFEKKLKKK